MTDALHLPGLGPEPEPDPVDGTARSSTTFAVEVVRSARRKRTVGAQLHAGVLKVTVPTWMSSAETEMWTEKMAASFRRKMSAERIDLAAAPPRLLGATSWHALATSAGPTTW